MSDLSDERKAALRAWASGSIVVPYPPTRTETLALLSELARVKGERDAAKRFVDAAEWFITEVKTFDGYAGTPSAAWHVLVKRMFNKLSAALAARAPVRGD